MFFKRVLYNWFSISFLRSNAYCNLKITFQQNYFKPINHSVRNTGVVTDD